MKIRQCFLELQLKMSGMFFLRHTVASCDGQTIQWETELKYFRIHILLITEGSKCSLTSAKRLFYRAANAVFGKIGVDHPKM